MRMTQEDLVFSANKQIGYRSGGYSLMVILQINRFYLVSSANIFFNLFITFADN